MVVRAVVGFLFLSLGGCSTPEPYDAYSGREFVIECTNAKPQCYYKAQDKCRKGYDLLSIVESEQTGGVHGRQKVFTARVKCK